MNDELFEKDKRKVLIVKGMKINISQLSRDQDVCWTTAKKQPRVIKRKLCK